LSFPAVRSIEFEISVVDDEDEEEREQVDDDDDDGEKEGDESETTTTTKKRKTSSSARGGGGGKRRKKTASEKVRIVALGPLVNYMTSPLLEFTVKMVPLVDRVVEQWKVIDIVTVTPRFAVDQSAWKRANVPRDPTTTVAPSSSSSSPLFGPTFAELEKIALKVDFFRPKEDSVARQMKIKENKKKAKQRMKKVSSISLEMEGMPLEEEEGEGKEATELFQKKIKRAQNAETKKRVDAVLSELQKVLFLQRNADSCVDERSVRSALKKLTDIKALSLAAAQKKGGDGGGVSDLIADIQCMDRLFRNSSRPPYHFEVLSTVGADMFECMSGDDIDTFACFSSPDPMSASSGPEVALLSEQEILKREQRRKTMDALFAKIVFQSHSLPEVDVVSRFIQLDGTGATSIGRIHDSASLYHKWTDRTSAPYFHTSVVQSNESTVFLWKQQQQHEEDETMHQMEEEEEMLSQENRMWNPLSLSTLSSHRGETLDFFRVAVPAAVAHHHHQGQRALRPWWRMGFHSRVMRSEEDRLVETVENIALRGCNVEIWRTENDNDHFGGGDDVVTGFFDRIRQHAGPEHDQVFVLTNCEKRVSYLAKQAHVRNARQQVAHSLDALGDWIFVLTNWARGLIERKGQERHGSGGGANSKDEVIDMDNDAFIGEGTLVLDRCNLYTIRKLQELLVLVDTDGLLRRALGRLVISGSTFYYNAVGGCAFADLARFQKQPLLPRKTTEESSSSTLTPFSKLLSVSESPPSGGGGGGGIVNILVTARPRFELLEGGIFSSFSNAVNLNVAYNYRAFVKTNSQKYKLLHFADTSTKVSPNNVLVLDQLDVTTIEENFSPAVLLLPMSEDAFFTRQDLCKFLACTRNDGTAIKVVPFEASIAAGDVAAAAAAVQYTHNQIKERLLSIANNKGPRRETRLGYMMEGLLMEPETFPVPRFEETEWLAEEDERERDESPQDSETGEEEEERESSRVAEEEDIVDESCSDDAVAEMVDARAEQSPSPKRQRDEEAAVVVVDRTTLVEGEEEEEDDDGEYQDGDEEEEETGSTSGDDSSSSASEASSSSSSDEDEDPAPLSPPPQENFNPFL
jgi:hypothetical protein